MTAVIEPADARLSASQNTSSSTRWSLTGVQVDWTTYTSTPRTFSWMRAKTSPSENRLISARPMGSSSEPAIALASSGLLVPEKMLIDLNIESVLTNRLGAGENPGPGPRGGGSLANGVVSVNQ